MTPSYIASLCASIHGLACDLLRAMPPDLTERDAPLDDVSRELHIASERLYRAYQNACAYRDKHTIAPAEPDASIPYAIWLDDPTESRPHWTVTVATDGPVPRSVRSWFYPRAISRANVRRSAERWATSSVGQSLLNQAVITAGGAKWTSIP
jgi:hypothetical protein